MIIQIDKLKDNEKLDLEFSENLKVSSDYMLENNEVKADFKGFFKKKDDYFELDGNLTFEILVCCSRCLTPVLEKFDVPVLELFKNGIKEFNDVSSDDNYYYFDTLEVDINESLLMNIQLHIPTSVLCNDDCEGLCQYCGINLNHESCSCEKPIDPRWESLKSLLDNK